LAIAFLSVVVNAPANCRPSPTFVKRCAVF
jgi:hypothetical protein